MDKMPDIIHEVIGHGVDGIIKKLNYPKHLIINTTNVANWSNKNNIHITIGFEKFFENLKQIFEIQIKNDIPILTLNIRVITNEENDFFLDLLSYLRTSRHIDNHQIKIFIIGKWYELNNKLIEEIKKIMSDTKEYDKYFLNFCVNYDGQEELVEGFRLLLRKCFSEKINPEKIDKLTIKENLLTSFFIPPDLVIEPYDKFTGTMLWDSQNIKIYFLNKDFLDFNKRDYDKAIEYFNKKYI